MAPWWLRSSSDEQVSDDESQPQEVAGDAEEVSAEGFELSSSEGAEEDVEEGSVAEDSAAEAAAEESGGTDGSSGPDEDEDSEERPKRRRPKRRRRRRRDGEEPADGGEHSEGPEASTEATPAAPPKFESRGSEAPRSLQFVGSGDDSLETYSRDLIYSLGDRGQESDERTIAMFCDFENLALGVRGAEGKDSQKFEIQLVLERLLEKGKIIVKKAYADWQRYAEYKRPFHEAAIELIDIPQKRYSGKNSADIKMVVDAMDLCYSKNHLDTFAIVSGDSDFSPLVSKLRENNKHVIGIGIKNSTSQLLVDNCDEFIYYEDVHRDGQKAPRLDHLSPQDAEVFGLMVDAMLALIREGKEVLWGSMIKQTMKRKRPSFSEGYYGYGSFTELLEDAQVKKIIHLKRDRRAGTYVVTGFAR